MRRFLTFLMFMLIMTFRNPILLFFNLLVPLGLLLLFGFIFGQHVIPLPGGSGVSYSIWLLPGIIVMNIIASGLMGNSSAMITWRERGIFRRILVTPTAPWEVMLARACTQVLMIVIQSILSIFVGSLVFNFKFNWLYAPLTLLFIVLGSLVFLLLGQVIASFIDRVELGNIISQALYLLMTFLTGIMLPLQILPDIVSKVAPFTPSYMVAELLRSAMLQGSVGSAPLADIGGCLLYSAVALGLSAAFFRMLR
ncbi:ABC transporter permease [Thermogemmatispora sp.]|uniref:ABC transporter permease n=1 Tax=Thermogemmatispora sp. TaxID=1968838 RepID=UPI001DD39564|nr:ABC transporter permease [Thermogemmatispora sp.]MBX5450414.1 ABC transporter permease [Thermogemmatispora sp.]